MVLIANDQVWLCDCLQQLVGYAARVHALGDPRQHDHELVSAETRHHVLFAYAGTHAAGGLGQHQVRAVVAQAGVDFLEAVEVDEQQRQAPAIPAGLPDLLRQVFLQVLPVRQRRGGIEMGVGIQRLRARGGSERGAEPAHQRARIAGFVAADLAGTGKTERNYAQRLAVVVDRKYQCALRPELGLRFEQAELPHLAQPDPVRWHRQQLDGRRIDHFLLGLGPGAAFGGEHYRHATGKVAVKHADQQYVAAGAVQQVAGGQFHQTLRIDPRQRSPVDIGHGLDDAPLPRQHQRQPVRRFAGLRVSAARLLRRGGRIRAAWCNAPGDTAPAQQHQASQSTEQGCSEQRRTQARPQAHAGVGCRFDRHHTPVAAGVRSREIQAD